MKERLIQKLHPILIALMAFLVSAVLFEVVIQSYETELEQQKRTRTIQYLSGIRARIEGSFNSSIYLTETLEALLTSQKYISREEFDTVARALVSKGPLVRNLGLAEGYVITRVYPLRGNEGALGLDYRDNIEQWPLVKRAMEERKTLVAGPLNLVQGGTGVIIRTPIYVATGDPGKTEQFWGIASVVMDFEQVLSAAGLPDLNAPYLVTLRGRDGLGETGEVFWGDANLLQRDPVTMEVELPNGSWQLAALPIDGWYPEQEALWLRGGATLISLLIALLSLVIVRDSQKLRHLALHDPLTGLPNRHLFNRRVEQSIALARRHRRKLALAVLDLNRFKPVNDRFGHLAGDYVLKEVARRVLTRIRAEDTLARTGGDEFTLLLSEIHEAEDAETVASSLAEAIRLPFHWQGQEITIAVSIGIAIFPDQGKDLNSLFQQADHAMYQAKGNQAIDWKVASSG